MNYDPQTELRRVGQSPEVPSLAVDPVHREEPASKIIGVSRSTMSKWRMSGKGPEWVRLGEHLIGYRQSALDRFVAGGAQ